MQAIELIKTVREFGLYAIFKRYYSFYRASVVDNDDPENMGRLKVRCKTVYRDATPDKWVIPRGAIAGNKSGFFHIPQIGDAIYLSFEEGDARFPVWEYGWWYQGKAPNDTNPKKSTWITADGTRIDLDSENSSINIKTNTGIEFDLSGGKFALKTNAGSLFTELNNTLTQIQALTVGTVFGPSTPPLNIAAFLAIQNKLKLYMKA